MSTIRLHNLAAKVDALTDVVGREDELKRLVQILLRPIHHHAVIFGEPGVGKSSLVELLALGIAEGALPQLPKKLYLLDTAPILSLFVGGESLHVCFETLRTQMSRLETATIIVEDIQLLAGNDPGRLELTLELLQTLILHPSVRLIVTTTQIAYRQLFRSNYVFNRTFIPLELQTPDKRTVATILKRAAHHMNIADEALEQIISLSERYGRGQALPDAALRLLEEVSIKTEFSGHNKITISDIREAVSERENVPLASLNPANYAHLVDLEDRLNEAVIGQTAALRVIARTITNAHLGLRDESRPRGSFLLLGPSGVGKTETAKALTQLVYANSKALVRLDMSEYSEPHSAVRLTGSPPGYVGYEEGGQLTDAIERQPYSLVLLDEIEKAHPKLFDVFLQLLDDGRLTDSSGKTADFTQTLLIATSNIGSAEIGNAYAEGIDVSASSFTQTTLMPLLLKHFRPEFINRFDAILVYRPLGEGELVALARRELRRLEMRLSHLNVSFDVSDQLLTKLLRPYYNPLFGARVAKRLIASCFETPVAQRIINKQLENYTVITGEEPWLELETYLRMPSAD